MGTSSPLPGSRRALRLPGFDYRTPAGYFVTVCTAGRRPLFGRVVDGKVELSTFGAIVREEWFRTAAQRPNVLLFDDELVVMPDHLHGIVWLVAEPSDPAPRHGNPAGSLPAVVGAFKAAAARRINAARGTPGRPVWQRSYWERIVRSDRELAVIRRYIAENPLRWEASRLAVEEHRDLLQSLQALTSTEPDLPTR